MNEKEKYAEKIEILIPKIYNFIDKNKIKINLSNKKSNQNLENKAKLSIFLFNLCLENNINPINILNILGEEFKVYFNLKKICKEEK